MAALTFALQYNEISTSASSNFPAEAKIEGIASPKSSISAKSRQTHARRTPGTGRPSEAATAQSCADKYNNEQ